MFKSLLLTTSLLILSVQNVNAYVVESAADSGMSTMQVTQGAPVPQGAMIKPRIGTVVQPQVSRPMSMAQPAPNASMQRNMPSNSQQRGANHGERREEMRQYMNKNPKFQQFNNQNGR